VRVGYDHAPDPGFRPSGDPGPGRRRRGSGRKGQCKGKGKVDERKKKENAVNDGVWLVGSGVHVPEPSRAQPLSVFHHHPLLSVNNHP